MADPGTSLEQLREAVLADPDDHALRRALAERLITMGDERGELIVVQLALSEGSPNPTRRRHLQQREAALLRSVLDRFGKDAGGLRFRAGFVEELVVSGSELGAMASLLAREPVRAMQVQRADDGTMRRLIACPVWGRLRALKISGELGRAGMERLGSSPGLQQLERLNLAHCRFEAADLEPLVRSRFFHVRRLTLTTAPLGDEGAALLAAGTASWRERCRELFLARCEIGDEGARALLGPGVFPQLDQLGLGGNDLGEGCLAAVEVALASGAVRTVELGGTQLAPRELSMLCKRWGDRVRI